MHALRGGAGSVGATALQDLAAGLEAALDRGDTELEARLATLELLFEDLRASCAPWLERSTPPSTPAPPPDPGRVAALREALQARDLAALRRFEELRPSLEGSLGPGRAERLGRAMARLRFDEAEELLGTGAASREEGPDGEGTP